MSYKLTVEDQKEFSYDEFLRIIKKIEDNFTDNVCEYIRGRYIYVLLSGAFEQSFFVKTTVSDLQDVLGKINFDCIVDNQGIYNNVALYSIKEPGKKDFRGKIKYTPNHTLSVSTKFIGVNEDGTRGVAGFDKLPFLQDEKFVNSSCDNLYNCDEEGADYDFIEQHAFRALANDRRLKCGDDYVLTTPGIEQEISQSLQRIICNMYDVTESWAVCYEYKGNCFMFPLKQKYIKEIFKNRDKVNGRRQTIAAIVKSYKKADGSEVDGHLRSADGFTIDGREFSILIGGEDFEKIFPKTDKSAIRVRKMHRELRQISDTDFAYT